MTLKLTYKDMNQQAVLGRTVVVKFFQTPG